MKDPRIREVLRLLDPPPGEKLWYGGASPLGCLRGVTARQAAWKPAARPHSIWELTLHVAFWTYVVRKRIAETPDATFPRSPSNWPAVPSPADEKAWKADRALLREEHERLVEVVRAFDPKRLDQLAPQSKKERFVDLMFGIIAHDLYHVGQIQILKRLSVSRRRGR